MADEALSKGVIEKRPYRFDFTKYPEIIGGATISSAITTMPTGGTLTVPTAWTVLTGGGKIEGFISNGTGGQVEQVRAKAILSQGGILEGIGLLQINS